MDTKACDKTVKAQLSDRAEATVTCSRVGSHEIHKTQQRIALPNGKPMFVTFTWRD